MRRLSLIFLLTVSLVTLGALGALAVDNGSGLGIDSAHNSNPPNTQGVCAKCHVPHGGQGDKIWASDPTARVDFLGVQQLCNTCHYSGNPVGATFYPVFQVVPNQMDHVMHDWADTAGPTIPAYDAATFPLDTTDTYLNMPWGGTDPDGTVGDDGFYCGSCHNPHRQPVLDGAAREDDNGDYLRAIPTTFALFGGTDDRRAACTQCHSAINPAGVSSGHEQSCSVCHDPHEGVNDPTGAQPLDDLAEKILIVSGATTFIAPPNVPGWTAGSAAALITAICVDCHESEGALPTDLPFNSQKIINTTTEHHPMGTNAPNPADQGDHAPGYTVLGGGELSCTGCHDMHDGAQDYYIDAAFTYAAQDDPAMCVACRTQHNPASLGASNTDHNQVSSFADGDTGPPVTFDSNPRARGGCMLCHYIHDGTDNPGAVAPGVDPSEDAVMRFDAANLAWADTAADGDDLDYEDMCYGCHWDSTVTGAAGSIGGPGSSFANAGAPGYSPNWFSHRTNSAPSAVGDNPVAGLAAGAGLPMFGDAAEALHAYTGSVGGDNVAGEMYCGTCHDVHVQNTTDSDGNYFRVDHNTGAIRSGMCIACHGAAPMTAAGSSGTGSSVSHPVGGLAVLPDPVTANPVDPQYGNGGDGFMGGRTSGNVPNGGGDATGQMQCETCHNFHVSVTNHEGSSAGHAVIPAQDPEGKLMILNNSSSGLCGTCHINY